MAESRVQFRPDGQSKTPRPRGPSSKSRSDASLRGDSSQNSPSQVDRTEGSTVDADNSVAVISMLAIDRDLMIAEAAYFRAMERNFEPGHELEDWLAAESDVDRRLMDSPSRERRT